MKLQIFCVKDRATDQFGTPMFMVATGQAIRSFSDEINRSDKDNQLFSHPDDFDLYYLGTFDSDIGQFDVRVPEQICIGKQVKVRS